MKNHLGRQATPGFIALAAAILLSATVIFVVMPRWAPGIVDAFDAEGGPVELLSALFYLIGCAVCVYRLISKAPSDRPYLYLWALLCFIFFGEETSWLQHVIGYGTPEAIRAVNVQEEFNLHNLLDAGSWHEAFATGKLDYKLFLNTTFLFRVGFFSYFLLIPAMMHAGLFRGIGNRLGIPLPSVAYMVVLGATMFLSVVGYYLVPDLRGEVTEARELYYALFVALYAILYPGVPNRGDS